MPPLPSNFSVDRITPSYFPALMKCSLLVLLHISLPQHTILTEHISNGLIKSIYFYSNFSRPTDSGAIGKDQSHNANQLKSTRPMGMFQGNLLRGIDNYSGAARSVVQVCYKALENSFINNFSFFHLKT